MTKRHTTTKVSKPITRVGAAATAAARAKLAEVFAGNSSKRQAISLRTNVLALVRRHKGEDAVQQEGGQWSVRWAGQTEEERVIDQLLNVTQDDVGPENLARWLITLVGHTIAQSQSPLFMVVDDVADSKAVLEWVSMTEGKATHLCKYQLLLPSSTPMEQARLQALTLCRMLCAAPQPWRDLPQEKVRLEQMEWFVFWEKPLEVKGKSLNLWRWSVTLSRSTKAHKDGLSGPESDCVHYSPDRAVIALVLAASVARLAIHGYTSDSGAVESLLQSTATAHIANEYLATTRGRPEGLLELLAGFYMTAPGGLRQEGKRKEVVMGRMSHEVSYASNEWTDFAVPNASASILGVKSGLKREFGKKKAKGKDGEEAPQVCPVSRVWIRSRDMVQILKDRSIKPYLSREVLRQICPLAAKSSISEALRKETKDDFDMRQLLAQSHKIPKGENDLTALPQTQAAKERDPAHTLDSQAFLPSEPRISPKGVRNSEYSDFDVDVLMELISPDKNDRQYPCSPAALLAAQELAPEGDKEAYAAHQCMEDTSRYRTPKGPKPQPATLGLPMVITEGVLSTPRGTNLMDALSKAGGKDHDGMDAVNPGDKSQDDPAEETKFEPK